MLAALGIGHLIQPLFGIETVDLVFLTAMVAVAVRFGLWPSLPQRRCRVARLQLLLHAAALTFTIAEPTNVAAFIFFTIVAVLVSNLAARVRPQALAAQSRARTTEALYSFSRKLPA